MKKSAVPTRPAPRDLPAISEAEWVVMQEFWRRGRATVAELVEALAAPQDWKPATIQTLVVRLHKKGALEFTKQGREHVYSPTVTEADCVHHVSRSFVDRVFDGRLAPLIACFAEREKLDARDLEELRSLLKENSP